MLILVLSYLYRIIYYAILVYCIGSWFVAPGTKLFYYWQKLGYYLDPLFRPARFILQKLDLFRIRIDFTPWLTIILLNLVYQLIFRLFLF